MSHKLDQLQSQRLAAGYSVTRLAEIAAVSDFTIVRLENGDSTEPPISQRISDALQVPLSANVLTISGNTLANPTEVTTTAPHSLVTGQSVTITGSNSTPVIDGVRVVTVTSPTKFTIPVNCTGAGTAGTVTGPTLGLRSL